ncbi:MAG TPA: pyridoxal-phosphate dependent enzyme [Thermoanaerobaculia bacterium]|nr:pyridoxal-phosphate dependent enzyme [Thermoanaerobaculia bacterium]
MTHTLLPTMIELGPNFWAARFELMKRVNAFGVVRRARREGLLGPGGMVIETTSGSMGIGLAEVCKEDGYRCILVTDEMALDDYVRQRLRDLDAEVHVVPNDANPGATQANRLQRLDELRRKYPHAYWTNQYDNPWNSESYSVVADEILARLEGVDVVVCSVGSGGSSCGIAQGLRRSGCDPSLIAVDLRGSVIFGLPSGIRRIRGMGNGIEPGNVDHAAYDEVHWLSDSAVIAATQRLASTHRGVDAGPTSGAAFLVAEWKHRREPSKVVCAVFPDSAERYRKPFGDPEWVIGQGLHLDRTPSEPIETEEVPQTTPDADWTMLRWKRRSYQDVTGRPWRASAPDTGRMA